MTPHVWLSTVDSTDRPDRMVFDLGLRWRRRSDGMRLDGSTRARTQLSPSTDGLRRRPIRVPKTATWDTRSHDLPCREPQRSADGRSFGYAAQTGGGAAQSTRNVILSVT